MRHFLLLLLLSSGYLSIQSIAQSVAINTDGSLANSSALLDVKSATKGILIPRLTETQRNAISSPATSLMIYQVNNSPGYYYNSGTPAVPVWTKMLQGSDNFWQANGDHIFNTNTAYVGIGTSDPKTRLHVIDSSVLFSAEGDAILPGTVPPITGPGRRLMWYVGKAAFRVGYVPGNAWDNNNIGVYSIGLGYNTQARGFASLAMGSNAQANGDNSASIGAGAIASGSWSLAAGTGVTASGNYSSAFGQNTIASSNNTVVFGNGSTAAGSYSIAAGEQSVASGNHSLALGYHTQALGNHSIVAGFNSQATNDYCFALGPNATASGYSSVAIGNFAKAPGDFSFSLGLSTTTGKASFSLGEYLNTTLPAGDYSLAIGNLSDVTGDYSFVAGESANVAGNYAAARGFLASAGGNYSSAWGYNAQATGEYSFAYGPNTLAANHASFAIGDNSNAGGAYSLAMGPDTQSGGSSALAFGFSATASADFALSMGLGTSAQGFHSIAFGSAATAIGSHSIALGYSAQATSSYAIAMGENTTASGIGSFSRGYNTSVSGNYATAFGEFNTAKAKNAFTVGSLNDNTDNPSPSATAATDRIFQVGNGDINVRSNAITVLRNGNTGIGTVLPSSPLQFSNATGRKITLYESPNDSHYGFAIQGGQLQMYSDAAAAKISFGYYTSGLFTERMWLNNASGVLTVSATAYPSDERFKKNIRPLDNPLQKILRLDGVEYQLRTTEFPGMHFSNDKQIGLLAQQVEEVIPSAVYTINEQGYKGVDYAKLVPLLIESIKAQQEQIEELKRLVGKDKQ